METPNDFLYALKDIEEVRRIESDLIEFWGSDYPVTLLFSNIGKSLVKNSSSYSVNQRMRILSVVDEIMYKGNETMKSYVATGFLESLVSEAQRDGVWDDFSGFIGENSKTYIDAWSKF